MSKRAERILICTEEGHFKQWILYSDGSVEYGAIGKKQQKVKYNLRTGHDKADQKLRSNRSTGQYKELTQQQYEKFMHGYELLCKYGTIAVSALESMVPQMEEAAEEGRCLIL